jgi:DNA-binding NtrC family response regulator
MAPSSTSTSREPDPPCTDVGVLIIDDDPPFRHGLAALLREDGHEVHDVEQAGDLPPLATLHWVAVVIADRQMVGEDAIVFADRFHGAHPGCPVVLVTPYRTPAMDAQVQARLFLHLAEKPVDYEHLHAEVHALAR